MAYCPECGSEVAPEDTFCAYCGITLSPAPLADESQNSSGDIFLKPETGEALESFESASKSQFQDADTVIKPKNPTENLQPMQNVSDASLSITDSSVQIIEPDAELASGSESLQNPTVKTEPAEFSSVSQDSEKIKDKAGFTETENVETLDKSPAPESKIASENVEAENLDSDKEIPLNESKEKEVAPAETIRTKDVKDNFANTPQTDFQATIPYASADFTGQDFSPLPANNIEREVKDSEPETEKGKSDEILSTESKEAIDKPDIPVGSSSHDSIEPKLISVQIYNPNERSDEDKIDAKPAEEIKMVQEEPIPKQNEQAEAGVFTSPNIGTASTGGKKSKLKPLEVGTVLNGRYEIIRKIGGGGMGAVYLASDQNLGGVLRAVKEMVQSYIEDSQQEKAINDFRRESLLLTSLEHPSIPTIFDYFFDEKEARFYLVMKYISGGDLASRLRAAPEGRIDEKSITEWAIQIADVLDYLHNRQPPIVYRDLKPSNIMIDGNSGRVMLIDFGIARWVNKEEKGVTAVGTMGYAPPELFSGNVEPRSDIYSLGSTMFHLLTGADPQSNPLLIFDFQKNPRPRQINSRLSDQMEEILMQAVEYNSNKRFANAADMREVLTKHLEKLQKGEVTYGAFDGAGLAKAANEPVFCGFCGQKILASDMFCPFCGAQQPIAGVSVEGQTPFAVPRPTARVMVMGTGELDTPMFSLEKENNLVGRRDPMSNIFPEIDLSKFDPQTKVSRRHARIWRESDKFMLEDLGSSNGTVLITGSKESIKLAKNKPHVLAHGDQIRVGDTTLHFVVG